MQYHFSLQSTALTRLALGIALVTLTGAISTPAGASSGHPSAPRAVHATPELGSARVRWLKPASSGAAGAVHYVVTSHPSKKSCSTASTSCSVRGLVDGTKYSFTVVARNGAGVSPSSAPSNRVTIKISVAKAGSNYLAAVGKFNSALAQDLAAIEALTSTSTSTQLSSALSNLQKTFGTFTSTLRHDTWPSGTKVDMKALIPTIVTLGTDTANIAQATSANASLLYATLQRDGNLSDEADANVRTDLHLPQLISGPITTPVSPVEVGSSQVVHDFAGDALNVSVSSVVDPATAGADSGGADTGYRFVAVELNLSNPASAEIDGDANYSVSVIGSDGQTYNADYGTVAECTNFFYGSFDLPTNDTASGCVAFQLPTSVSVASVRFTLATGYLDTAVWSV